MSKPRLVVLSKLFWPEGSGAELATYLIVKNILSKHFDLTIVSGTKNPRIDVLKFCRYFYWAALNTKLKPFEWLKLFANIESLRTLIKMADVVYIPSHTLIPLAILIKQINPYAKIVLHLHNFQPLTYTSVVLKDKKSSLATDIIVEQGEHGSLVRTIFSGVGHYINSLNALALYSVDQIICVSKAQYEILARHLRPVREKGIVIYNPPPSISGNMKDLSDIPTIVYIGGSSYVKGFQYIVKAIPRLRKYRIRLFLCGEYPGYKIKRCTPDDKIKILGKLSHKELIKLYYESWGLLFTSICEEPLPYAVIEASLTGTIPIASKVGGIPELINDTGAEKFLFIPEDIDDMISKLEELSMLDKQDTMNLGEFIKRNIYEKLSTSSSKMTKVLSNLVSS